MSRRFLGYRPGDCFLIHVFVMLHRDREIHQASWYQEKTSLLCPGFGGFYSFPQLSKWHRTYTRKHGSPVVVLLEKV